MQPSEREWIERFLAHLKFERRMSSHTLAAYRHDLLRLMAFCARRDVRRWSFGVQLYRSSIFQDSFVDLPGLDPEKMLCQPGDLRARRIAVLVKLVHTLACASRELTFCRTEHSPATGLTSTVTPYFKAGHSLAISNAPSKSSICSRK